MGTKHITNNGTDTIYVGGKMIPPGEGRDIDESLLPAEHQDPPVEKAPPAPNLDELVTAELGKPVKEVIDGLGGLTQEALERMETLESEAKKPRKSLLEAIAAEKVQRADAAMQAAELERLATAELAKTAEDLIAGLDQLDDLTLDRMGALESAAEQPRAELLEAIAAELTLRKPA